MILNAALAAPNGRVAMLLPLNHFVQAPSELNFDQLAPPSARIVTSGSIVSFQSGVSKIKALLSVPIQRHLVCSSTRSSRSRETHYLTKGEAFITFGKTRFEEPVNVSAPSLSAQLITSFGPKASIIGRKWFCLS